mgnify:CR=1 FL=1
MAKILIVDDEAKIREVVKEYAMLIHGFEVEEAENGYEAITKVEHTNFDLIVLDIMMPVMDGFTLTRNIKQDQRFKSIPVVIHSSLTGTANEGHVKTVGADAYVAKFVAKELASTIRQVLTH